MGRYEARHPHQVSSQSGHPVKLHWCGYGESVKRSGLRRRAIPPPDHARPIHSAEWILGLAFDSPHPLQYNIVVLRCASDYVFLCGYGESNPDLMLGKHSFYH